ncbi:MAG: DUF3261 domain-containing protein [Deltaproteobacteria bacterium]|nr:DUF3261 domain-containing protein [Deltaproteobacteria bacterium]MBN2673282.1 DUF3261 domain-containing protein [Deltaproteobacteria bacterium]
MIEITGSRAAIRTLWLFCAFWMLPGCLGHSVNRKQSRVQYEDDVRVLYAAQAVQKPVVLVQQVIFAQGDETFEFTAMIEVGGESFSMAGLSPLGNRLFLLTADGQTIQYESQMLFELPFPPRFLVRDFLLMFGEERFLTRVLGSARCRFSDSMREFGAASDIIVTPNTRGETLIGKMNLENRRLGYSLEVTTVQADAVDAGAAQ